MKLMTWNIWDIPGAHARDRRLGRVAATLKAMAADPGGADVVLLQEVWSARRRPLLRPLYPHVGEAEQYWRNPMNWLAGPMEWLRGRYLTIDSGLMTLSRHPIREVRRLRYSKGRSPAKRSALATLIESPDLGPVWVVNTHLCAAYPRTTNTPTRLAQLHELGAYLRTLPGHPVIVGGDFNIAPPSVGPLPAWSHDPSLWPEAMQAALAGFHAAPEADGHLTYTATHNPWADPREGDNRLDYIFAGPGLVARDGRVAMTERYPLGRGRPKPLSDHFAVMTTVDRSP
ncbi:MAG: endonuclease/exonuclease/phosphatase family protein [Alphaproteobacteria bacterium]|nr:endonuclease/exonuclease/phosphatase family protein [Alphaproteobacteria bacterium]